MDRVLQRRDELGSPYGVDGCDTDIGGGEVGELVLREQRRVVGDTAHKLCLALDHFPGTTLGEQQQRHVTGVGGEGHLEEDRVWVRGGKIGHTEVSQRVIRGVY